MTTAIVASYSDAISVSFNSDAWFNATSVASSFGKRPVDWLRLDSTKEYISSLCEILRSEQSALLKTRRGRAVNGGETWFHPKLGVAFARWLDVKFAIWCDLQIEKILHEQTHPALESPTLTASDQQTLSEIVDHRARECANIGKAKAEIWSRIHRKFRVARYQQLAREQLSDAITYVMKMDIKAETLSEMVLPERTADTDNPNYAYAKQQLSSLYDWGKQALPQPVQEEFWCILKQLDRSLIKGWTEMDEALMHMTIAASMLNRWKRAH